MNNDIRNGKHPRSGPNQTVQADREHSDINAMSAKYLRNRLAGNPSGRKPMYIEVPSDSYHDMLNKVVKIQDTFRQLPAKLRARFQNQPGVLLHWVEQPENRREAVTLGLIQDPELLYQMEQENAQRIAAKNRAYQENVFRDEKPNPNKADTEANPSFKTGSQKEAEKS